LRHCIQSERRDLMNSKIYQYDAVIQSADKGGAYVAFPYDIRSEFGKGLVKVHATIFTPKLTGLLSIQSDFFLSI
jgi:hypothetical protein